jgi:aminodeoxyfutalosine synthase
MAGSKTPSALSTSDIETLIRDAGREPLERDTLYNIVRVPQLATA